MDHYTLPSAARKRRRRQWRRRRALLLVRVVIGVGGEARHQGVCRRVAGRDTLQIELLECRQRAAVERSGEGGAAGVGDLGAVEVERLDS